MLYRLDSDLKIKVAHHIAEVDEHTWNELSAGEPFQSHRWYRFGEAVMNDCEPFYVLAFHGSRLVGRAALWKIRDEPLPKMPALLRAFLRMTIRKFPLLICRSPLAFTRGVSLAHDLAPAPILAALAGEALEIARRQNCSFLLFDYLSVSTSEHFPHTFLKSANPSAGTIMENRWSSLEDYLASGNKKDRQHYKRTLREAEKLGIRIARHSQVGAVDDALRLIRSVERSHDALPNPWARRALEQMEMVNGIFLTATIGETLVGCGLLLEDNASQTTSLLGLAEDVPYAYFMLAYESLGIAFEHNVRTLRWGSGAYEVKERLGFLREDNGAFVFCAVHPVLQQVLQRFV